MDGQIELYGRNVSYSGQPLWILGDEFGANVYAFDIEALQRKQTDIPQEKLVEMFEKLLEGQRVLVAKAEVMDSVRMIVTVSGLEESIRKARDTIEFIEAALPILR